ncbi:MtnX-like HAD-IB family phosphatase [uncultured Alsobacter sp.]|uniref:MtnX-like HAD-IB family phosphatase n=1 Tax=uncultured Alsobacter sp. TaxID=1748258 RepID=UPI0025DF47F0|nr:MtnX-like HAD-IB family phosphatase [uncultured Alsobacter sp.]
MPSSFQILCDFDGTIALEDVTDAILTGMAAPEWHEIEREWAQGRIGSRACMTRQIALLSGQWADLHRIVDAIPIDPDFSRFVAFCAVRDLLLTVVSDGLDAAIHRILSREGLSLPVRANRLQRWADGSWSLDTPFASPSCSADAAHCKCLSLSRRSDTVTVVIGDGRSDICVAERADFVFARSLAGEPSTLLKHCRASGLPHLPYATFADVIGGLDALARQASPGTARIKDFELHG